jgi:hypothetical protein
LPKSCLKYQKCDPKTGGCVSDHIIGPGGCDDSIIIDFDKDANGYPIKPGTYVRNEWKSLGLVVDASGTKSATNGARILDTTNPGSEEDGDPDLGAPNQRCTPGGGPGIGEGGEPKSAGENCQPQGNVLIVQEDNSHPEIPDDKAGGGIITLDFFEPGGLYVYEIGLLGIDEATTVQVIYEDGRGGFITRDISVPDLGDNSFQVVKIDQANVRWIKVMMTRSGAVTYVKFCPGNLCKKITVDFDTDANGNAIQRGAYVRNEWASLGLVVDASGTENAKKGARIFDTTNPGSQAAGDPDLGAPNSQCKPAGPGIGVGGQPRKKGENCQRQGNVLIVQEDDSHSEIPDDAADGGTITLDFPDGKYVNEIGLLDIDYATTLTVIYKSTSGKSVKSVRAVPILGDNSFQILTINKANVKWIILTMTRGGAVTFVSFCE